MLSGNLLVCKILIAPNAFKFGICDWFEIRKSFSYSILYSHSNLKVLNNDQSNDNTADKPDMQIYFNDSFCH